MSQEQGTKLRNGKILESTSENNPIEPSTMTESNSAEVESIRNSDVSSELTEIRENYKKRIKDLQSEFSQLNDLMMAILKKSNSDSQDDNSQGSSKQPKQGLDIHSTLKWGWKIKSSI